MQRLSSVLPKKEIEEIFTKMDHDVSLINSYSIDRHQPVSMVINEKDVVKDSLWGMNPIETKRSIQIPFVEYEKAHVKPTFRMTFRKNKGVALIDSFYVWDKKVGIPYRVTRESGGVMVIPCVFFELTDDQITCTLLVRNSLHSLSTLTEVEPLIFTKEEISGWLSQQTVETHIDLLRQNKAEPFVKHRVSNKVMVKGFSEKILHQEISEEPSLFG